MVFLFILDYYTITIAIFVVFLYLPNMESYTYNVSITFLCNLIN